MKKGILIALLIIILGIFGIKLINQQNTIKKQEIKTGFYPGIVKAGHLIALDMAPLFIAKEMGFFKEEGIKVETIFFSSPGDNNAALAGGSIQFSTNPFTLPYFGVESGVPMRIISSAGGDGIIEVVVQGSLKINNREELKKWVKNNPEKKLKIGLLQGDTLDMIVYRMLKEDGMSYNDFEIVWFNDLFAMVQSFKIKQIDILSHIKPYTTNLEINYGAKVITNSNIIWGKGTPNTTVAILDDFGKKYPETVKAYLRGIDRGLKYIINNPEKSAEILNKNNYFKISKSVLLKSLKSQTKAVLKPNKEGIMIAISDMVKQGYIKKPKKDIILDNYLNNMYK